MTRWLLRFRRGIQGSTVRQFRSIGMQGRRKLRGFQQNHSIEECVGVHIFGSCTNSDLQLVRTQYFPPLSGRVQQARSISMCPFSVSRCILTIGISILVQNFTRITLALVEHSKPFSIEDTIHVHSSHQGDQVILSKS
jgi:hypothetical protein